MGKDRREELSVLGPREEFLERMTCCWVIEAKEKKQIIEEREKEVKSEGKREYKREPVKEEDKRRKIVSGA